jgi:transcriptional regulator
MNLKGSLPLLILHILKDGPNHGYRIAKRIKRESGGVLDFKEGTLYPTLHSLEKQGLIEAYQEIENGRTRRYYRLTGGGRKALADELEQWHEYANAVNAILQGASAR